MISKPAPIIRSIGRFHLKSDLSDSTVSQIQQYLRDFGAGTSMAERLGGEVVIHAYHQLDFDLMRSELGALVRSWEEGRS